MTNIVRNRHWDSGRDGTARASHRGGVKTRLAARADGTAL